MNLKLERNFLDEKYFKEIKSKITSPYFPWYFQPNMTKGNYEWERPYFSHKIYDEFLPNSNCFDIFKPLLNKLEVKSLIRLTVNLNINFDEQYYSSWHTDQQFPCKVAILYINTNNGFTEIKNDKEILKIDCEENKIIMFDNHCKHRSVSQTDDKRRIVINLNYI